MQTPSSAPRRRGRFRIEIASVGRTLGYYDATSEAAAVSLAEDLMRKLPARRGLSVLVVRGRERGDGGDAGELPIQRWWGTSDGWSSTPPCGEQLTLFDGWPGSQGKRG